MKDDDLQWLLEAVQSVESGLAGTVWYLFGSVLQPDLPQSDIDVLILYEKRDHVLHIRKQLAKWEMVRPLDLLFMTFQEEAELGFVQSEVCVEIFPACAEKVLPKV